MVVVFVSIAFTAAIVVTMAMIMVQRADALLAVLQLVAATIANHSGATGNASQNKSFRAGRTTITAAGLEKPLHCCSHWQPLAARRARKGTSALVVPVAVGRDTKMPS